MNTDEMHDNRHKVEYNEKWNEWIPKIPALKFKSKWRVKVIPPFHGALVRFYVEYKGAWVSVYLDVYDNLGYYCGPYWEIYPMVHNDIERVDMEDAEGLIDNIKKSIKHQLKGK